jgi:predicted RNase H-like HicB family nuclease
MPTYPSKLTIIVRRDDDGPYWAEVKELPGCFASGYTLYTTLRAVSEAVTLYVTDTARHQQA